MSMQDSDVNSQGCRHLFTVTGNISLAIIWQIANKAQLLYVFMVPTAILHSGMGDAACKGKSISHLFASTGGEKIKKASDDYFRDKPYNSEYSHNDWW